MKCPECGYCERCDSDDCSCRPGNLCSTCDSDEYDADELGLDPEENYDA